MSTGHSAPQFPAVPPPGGWRLLEAFQALCPCERLYKIGDPMLEREWRALANGDNGEDPVYHLRVDQICKMLVTALRERRDLEITGHNLDMGVGAPRTRLTHTLLVTANATVCGIPVKPGLSIGLRGRDTIDLFSQSGSWLSGEAGPVSKKIATLIGVRIDTTLDPAGAREVSGLTCGTQRLDTEDVRKTTYTEEEVAAWQRERVNKHDPANPPPTGRQCYKAACKHFGQMPREWFLSIRRPNVPLTWKTPGPRSRRTV